MLGIQKKPLLVVLIVAVVVIFGVFLWWHGVLTVPGLVVRSIGRVASVVHVRGTMDVQLPTVLHRQEHSLSCEIASLKMALQTVGVDVSESELIASLSFDRTPKGGGVWGDPNKGFVGNIDGKMLVDGYGVYWDPIASVGSKYRRTEVIRNGSVSDIASHISAGRPVIVWGNYGRGKMYSWLSSSGVRIGAVNGEHTRVVTGFSGSVDNPTHFSLIDPIYGPMTWSASKLMANWGLLGNNGVVVYPSVRWVRAVGDGKVWEISTDGTKRHWVRSWSAFVNRGGSKSAIQSISSRELSEYTVGGDIVK